MPSSGFDAFEQALHDHAKAWMAASGQVQVRDGVFEDPPGLRWPNASWDPEGVEPYWEVRILWVSRERYGSTLQPRHDATGILQHGFVFAAGDGTSPAMQLADRVEDLWAAAAIAGFRSYGVTGPPREGSAPEGWHEVQVDVRFRWHTGP